MIKREEKSFELVNEKLKLFISYLDISIQSHTTLAGVGGLGFG